MPWTKVFLTEDDLKQFAAVEGLRSLSYVAALREAQEQLLETDPGSLFWERGWTILAGFSGRPWDWWISLARSASWTSPLPKMA